MVSTRPEMVTFFETKISSHPPFLPPLPLTGGLYVDENEFQGLLMFF